LNPDPTQIRIRNRNFKDKFLQGPNFSQITQKRPLQKILTEQKKMEDVPVIPVPVLQNLAKMAENWPENIFTLFSQIFKRKKRKIFTV
jgi:hypothetical protein